MSEKDSLSPLFSFFSIIIAIFAVIVSIRSCTITEEQAKRYYREIVFTGTRDSKNNLTIHQVSGSLYFLDEVLITPYYVGDKTSPFREGEPYVLDLGGAYKGKDVGYFIPDIHKLICLVQKIENCEKQKFVLLRMEYKIDNETKFTEIK